MKMQGELFAKLYANSSPLRLRGIFITRILFKKRKKIV